MRVSWQKFRLLFGVEASGLRVISELRLGFGFVFRLRASVVDLGVSGLEYDSELKRLRILAFILAVGVDSSCLQHIHQRQGLSTAVLQ